VNHETDDLLRIADDLEFHGEQCHQMAWRIREQWQAAHDSQTQDGTGRSRSRSPHRATMTQSNSGRMPQDMGNVFLMLYFKLNLFCTLWTFETFEEYE